MEERSWKLNWRREKQGGRRSDGSIKDCEVMEDGGEGEIRVEKWRGKEIEKEEGRGRILTNLSFHIYISCNGSFFFSD
jgi:hypothetical protein